MLLILMIWLYATSDTHPNRKPWANAIAIYYVIAFTIGCLVTIVS